MYILKSIYNGSPQDVLVAKHKKDLVKLLKENGYYYSTCFQGYIDDKTRRKALGKHFEQGSLYRIEHIEVLSSDSSYLINNIYHLNAKPKE